MTLLLLSPSSLAEKFCIWLEGRNTDTVKEKQKQKTKQNKSKKKINKKCKQIFCKNPEVTLSVFLSYRIVSVVNTPYFNLFKDKIQQYHQVIQGFS